MKVLRPIKGTGRRVKEVKFATADIEAYDWIKFICIGFYDGHNKTYKWFKALDEFAEWIFSYCYKHDITNIFMHFGGKYDFNFLLQEYCFNDNYVLDEIIPRGSGLLSFKIAEYSATMFKANDEPFEITFRDSSALLPFALRSLAKAFKVPQQKGEMDFLNLQEAFNNKNYVKKLLKNKERYDVFYGKSRRIRKWKKGMSVRLVKYRDKKERQNHKIYKKKDVLQYLRGDCVSQWEVIEQFYKWPLIQKAGACFTTASQAVKIWQTFLKKPINSIPRTVDEFVREGYFGGRTEIFRPLFDSQYNIKKNKDNLPKKSLEYLKKQKKLKTIFYYDVNSLYPTIMQNNQFPNKFTGWAVSDHYRADGFGFWECEVTVPEMFCPPLGIKHTFADGTIKFIFPTGTFKGIWCTEEIEYAKTLGIKINRIYRGATFSNGGFMFKDFVKSLYAIRLEAKANNDGVGDLNSKLIMNSCYGRLGLNIERENLIIDEAQSGVNPHSEVTRDGVTIRFASKPVVLEDSFTNVAIPAYVTALSRILMHKDLYIPSGKKHLYYTDTDSVFTTKKMRVGNKLGQVKLEYECDSACFLLPKTYINNGVKGEKFTKKLTMKGFDKKKIKHFTLEDFTLALRGDLKNLHIYQAPKFATLKTALKRNAFLDMINDPKANKQADIRRLKALKVDLKSLIKSKDDNLLKNMRSRIKLLDKKIKKDEYLGSYRGIKSKYDKRDIIDNGFMSKAIHLKKEI